MRRSHTNGVVEAVNARTTLVCAPQTRRLLGPNLRLLFGSGNCISHGVKFVLCLDLPVCRLLAKHLTRRNPLRFQLIGLIYLGMPRPVPIVLHPGVLCCFWAACSGLFLQERSLRIALARRHGGRFGSLHGAAAPTFLKQLSLLCTDLCNSWQHDYYRGNRDGYVSRLHLHCDHEADGQQHRNLPIAPVALLVQHRESAAPQSRQRYRPDRPPPK